MQGKRYTTEEIKQLYKEFERGTSLSDLEGILDRSCCGILSKLKTLSKDEPDKWNKDRVLEYTQQHYQIHREETIERVRKYHHEHKDEIAKRRKKYRLSQESRERRAEYLRQYRQRHKKEIAAYYKRWREDHKEELKEKKRKYAEKNRKRIAEQSRKYREKNKDEIARYRRQHYQENKWYKLIADTGDIGYDIDDVISDGKGLDVKLAEDDVDISSVRRDFMQHLQDALLKAELRAFCDRLQLEFLDNILHISFDYKGGKHRDDLECFLRAYARVLRDD